MIFLIAGSVFFWMLILRPLLKTRAAASWPTTEARIVDSKIVEHDGDDGSSWSAEFTYEYTVNGKEYENDRYSFLTLSGSRRSADKLQKQHPIGSPTPCYYDPADPSNSVMNRSIGWNFLIGLLPLAFAVVGGIVLYGVLFREWGSGPRQPTATAHLPVGTTTRSAARGDSGFSSQHPDDRLDQEFDGPLKLKPAVSKWVVLGIGLLFGLFWNGIVSFFVFHVIDEGFPIFLTLFMLPFVLVGLGITFFCIYVFLSLFNPKIEVALSNGAVTLGEEVDVAWEVLGNARKIRKLDIHIQGEEIATYRRGTDTHTDTNTFRMIPIVSTDQSDEIPFGTTTVRIPADTMHSLDAGNNQIKWSIQVKGDIPWWPDVNESLIFRVRPFFQ